MSTFHGIACHGSPTGPSHRGIRRILWGAAVLLTGLAGPGLGLAGCAAHGDGGRAAAVDEASYVMVFLTSGPKSGQGTPEERREIFKGHMSNMARLADERTLIIAGPFDHPHNPAWRGIFVFDVATLDQARELVATDPGVIAGEFTPELRELRASSGLRAMPEIQKELTRDTPPAAPGEPPANIRAYVMVTSDDAAALRRGLAGTPLEGKLLWWGRFAGKTPAGGVFVLDAKDAKEVESVLSSAQLSGTCDGWWSSTGLTLLPAKAKL